MIRVTDIHKSFGTLEVLKGVSLDDTEIDLPYIVEGENAVFTLDFTDAEIPTALIRLIPTAE